MAVSSSQQVVATRIKPGYKWSIPRLLRGSWVIIPISALLFLWMPIVVLVVFSFNDSRTVNTWRGFTTQWYENIFSTTLGVNTAFATDVMLQALQNSLLVSFTATIIATILGTMLALSLERWNYPGKRFIDALLLLPIVTPEIAQGVSMAIFFQAVFEFLQAQTGQRYVTGFGTIIIGHVVFNLSYVTVVVRARLADMHPKLEEAAIDLGASPWRTFWRITFPLAFPGILAGAVLAMTLSLDDFVVTFFLSGVGTTTLPVFVYSLVKVAVTPEINALSTLMLIVSSILITFTISLQGRKAQ
ncbi:MAG: ABC transporter permease [Anaerolineae bacterium]|nr:ABC transporter permease [Anaerolineae bacterium]